MLQVGQVMAMTVMPPNSAQYCGGALGSRFEYLYLQQGVVNGNIVEPFFILALPHNSPFSVSLHKPV